jgi:hypothetical protein
MHRYTLRRSWLGEGGIVSGARGTWKVSRGKFTAIFSGPWAQDRACLFTNMVNRELDELRAKTRRERSDGSGVVRKQRPAMLANVSSASLIYKREIGSWAKQGLRRGDPSK